MLPIITISRQYGSGGHEVGERLAEKLNIPLLDKELIALAAKKSGLSEEVFEKADEKAGSSLLYSMVMGNYTFGSRITGINERQLWHYAAGVHRPRKAQLEKIQNGINALSKELSVIDLV